MYIYTGMSVTGFALDEKRSARTAIYICMYILILACPSGLTGFGLDQKRSARIVEHRVESLLEETRRQGGAESGQESLSGVEEATVHEQKA